jgi:uncharacterized protein YjbI with pentapeptide repeats
MPNPEHLQLLQQGVAGWNAWRQQHRDDIRPDLGGADLIKADLIKADLLRATLCGADFGGADHSGADLTGADLIRAIFRGADHGWVKV